MFCAHLRFPILAVSTTHRQVGVACLGHDLEVLDVRQREFRHDRALPARAEFVRTLVEEMLRTHGAQTLIVDAHDRSVSEANAQIIAMLARAGRTRRCRSHVASFSEAIDTLGVATPTDAVRLLTERHDQLRERLRGDNAHQRLSARRYLENRPLIVAVALVHAAGLVSLSTEATQLSMPT